MSGWGVRCNDVWEWQLPPYINKELPVPWFYHVSLARVNWNSYRKRQQRATFLLLNLLPSMPLLLDQYSMLFFHSFHFSCSHVCQCLTCVAMPPLWKEVFICDWKAIISFRLKHRTFPRTLVSFSWLCFWDLNDLSVFPSVFPVWWKSDSIIAFIPRPTDREMEEQHLLDSCWLLTLWLWRLKFRQMYGCFS